MNHDRKKSTPNLSTLSVSRPRASRKFSLAAIRQSDDESDIEARQRSVFGDNSSFGQTGFLSASPSPTSFGGHSKSRRDSRLLNLFCGRRSSQEKENNFAFGNDPLNKGPLNFQKIMETEYETISPFLDIPTLEVFEDSRSRTVARMSMQIDSFFERKPVEGKIWAPPDSWAVTIPPPEEIKETSMINLMGATVSAPDLLSEFEEIDLQRDEQEMDFGYRRHGSTDSEFTVITQFSRSSDLGGLADPNMFSIRVFKPVSSGLISRNRRGSTSGFTFATITCPLNTTSAELCFILSKRFSISDVSNYRIYLYYRGCERVLGLDEEPLSLQKEFLSFLGYQEEDSFERLGRDDYGYYFRFVFDEWPARNQITSEYLENIKNEEESDVYLLEKGCSLVGLNLKMIPVVLFKFSPTMELLNLSRNPMLTIPIDFLQACTNLKTIILQNCSLINIPNSLMYAKSLSNLDLSRNMLDKSSLEFLSCIQSLTNLNLEGNRLDSLPDTFSSLKWLNVVNLSNNRFEVFPEVLFECTRLKELDLSANRIDILPSKISQLKTLKSFIMSRNRLFEIPAEFSELKTLIHLDLRYNKLKNCDSIVNRMGLKTVLIDGNPIEEIPGLNLDCLVEVSASNLLLSSIIQVSTLPSLRALTLSKCRLQSVNLDIFDYLPNIEILEIDHNLLEALPPSLSNCVNLKILSACHNKITEFPRNIEQLQELESINLACNRICEIPNTIWLCRKLKVLNVSSNKLSDFPLPPLELQNREDQPEAVFFVEWKQLLLAGNQFNDEIEEIFPYLHQIELIHLGFNFINDFTSSENFKQLHCLSELHVSGNELTSLPDEFDGIKTLKFLYLDCNKVSNLPAEIAGNLSLWSLDAAVNNLRYNVNNWPYDWNWNYNPSVKLLALSNNKKLEIKPPPLIMGNVGKTPDLSNFRLMHSLRLLDVCDVFVDLKSIPEQSSCLRVRAMKSGDSQLSYGMADALDRASGSLDTWDFFIPSYMSNEKDYLFGLFDGTTGSEIPKYICDSLPFIIPQEIRRFYREGIAVDYARVMKRSFLTLNKEICGQGMEGGSSGVVIFINETSLYISTVGLCQSVLCSKKGEEIHVAKCPLISESDEELLRLRNVGACISSACEIDVGIDKINCANAFGYASSVPFVTCNPSVFSFSLTGEEDFIILGTKNFWSFMPHELAVKLVLKEEGNIAVAVRKLRSMAIGYGSPGNFSVMIVSLHNVVCVASENAGVLPKQEVKIRKKRIYKEKDAVSDFNNVMDILPPVGDVTLVFTDVKHSPWLWENFPSAMNPSIKIHNSILRRLLVKYNGYEVKTERDAFMVAFQHVLDAVRWAVLVQTQLLSADWPLEIISSHQGREIYDQRDGSLLFRGLSISIGIHVGNPIAEMDPITKRMDYLGSVVNKAARVTAAGDGGQIMISSEVHQLLQSLDPSARVAIFDPVIYEQGLAKFKGIEVAEFLYSIYPRSLAGRHKYYKTSSNGSSSRVNSSSVIPKIDEEEVEPLQQSRSFDSE